MTLTTKNLPFFERANHTTNPTAKKLFQTMTSKQSNLAVNADVADSKTLLHFANAIGPEICVLKTHIDLLKDFTPNVAKELRQIADQHNFLIFEDRKFADIGTISKAQYTDGIYKIADWADIINAHTIPGPGIIEGLKEAGLPKGRALLLVAEMSSKDTLATGSYTQATVEMAIQHSDFVIGFICQSMLVNDPGIIHMTPGVKLQKGSDSLGQQYRTPQQAIAKQGCDIIIVGRGIIQAEDPVMEARKYKEAAWKGYLAKRKLPWLADRKLPNISNMR